MRHSPARAMRHSQARGMRHSIDEIKTMLAANVDALVQRILPNAKAERAEWKVGGIDGRPGRSLNIRRTGTRAGYWADFGSEHRGKDLISLIAAVKYNGDNGAAILWARRFLGLTHDDRTPAQRQADAERAARQRREKEEADARQQAKRRQRALELWHEAQPLKGTPGEAYLAGRGINFQRLARYPATLRFHPAMRCPETEALRPALICEVRTTIGFLTIHRIFLHPTDDGAGWTKADSKALASPPMQKAKVSFSASGGGFVPVWSGATRTWAIIEPEEWIVLCEGIEDALVLAMAQPALKVAAAISLSNIGKVQLPDCAGLILFADNDDNDAARAQFAAAKAALQARHVVEEVRAPAPFKDANDWALALAAETPR